MDFTDRQWEAIREADQHVMVVAGAGTGKTRTVVGRILYLLGVELRGRRIPQPRALHEIAAITFTNAAAQDLKDQVRTALKAAGRSQEAYLVDTARIGTIHGFCGEVLREFALRSGRNPSAEVLDEAASLALTYEVVRDALLQALEDRSIEGLPELLTERTADDVQKLVMNLLNDSDRLRTFGDARGELQSRERTLVDLAQQTSRLLDMRLEQRSAIDFDRIIVWTRDLLRGDAAVINALRRRITALIVDEFQDVDPVQKEIAYLLGDPGSGRADTTRLMLIGDPKQSIYRFRRADVTVWTEVKQDFEERGHGLVVRLDKNFRSTAPNLAFVDATIGRLLGQPLGGEAFRNYEVPYESVVAGLKDKQTGPQVELIIVPARPDNKDYRADEVRLIEASAVAQRAQQLFENDEAGWGEMALLLPTWSSLDIYKSALENVGADAYALRTDAFYEQREVVDMILALQTLRDPRDDRALFGFLRSPFVGLRDETLLSIARQIETPYWNRITSVEVREQELLAFAVDVLSRHVAMRDRVPTDELLESLLADTGYLGYLRLQGEGKVEAIANVQKFLRYAQAAASASVGAFLRTIQELRIRGEEVGDVAITPREDAVTLTTVHSAKGLEWKVVFWCDLVRWIGSSPYSELLIGRNNVALKDPELGSDEQPQYWQDLRSEIEQEETAERKRVWYVAATRAAERLIVSGLPAGWRYNGTRRSTISDYVWSVLPEFSLIDGSRFRYQAADGKEYQGVVRLADPTVLDSVPKEREELPELERAELLPSPLRPIAVPAGRPRHSATELLTFSRCSKKHWFKYVVGVREPEVDLHSNDFIDAVTRGQIIHDVLERLSEEDELDALLEDAIGRWDEDAPAPEIPEGRKYRGKLRREIKSVVDHPEYRAVADLPSARRELGFLYIDSPDAFYQGSIDLAAEEDDKLVLLDVKTSRVDAAVAQEKADRYRAQRDVYVTAANGISDTKVGRFAFQFSHPGVQVSQQISGETRDSSLERLRQMVSEMQVAPPRLTTYPAECKFCGYKKVGWCPGVAEVGSREESVSQLDLWADGQRE